VNVSVPRRSLRHSRALFETLDTAGPKTVGASNLGPSTQSARRLPVSALDFASSDRVRCFHPPKLPTPRFRRTSIPSTPRGFDATLHRAFEASSPEGLSTPSFLRQDFWSLQPGGPFTPQIRRPARIQTQDLRPLEPPLGDWEPQVRKDQNDTIASKSHEPRSLHSSWFRKTNQSRCSVFGSTIQAAGEPTAILSLTSNRAARASRLGKIPKPPPRRMSVPKPQ